VRLLGLRGFGVGISDGVSWLRSRELEAEEIEGFLLQGGGPEEFEEGVGSFDSRTADDFGEGAEVFQQGAEAVDGVEAVGGFFALFLFFGGGAALRGGEVELLAGEHAAVADDDGFFDAEFLTDALELVGDGVGVGGVVGVDVDGDGAALAVGEEAVVDLGFAFLFIAVVAVGGEGARTAFVVVGGEVQGPRASTRTGRNHAGSCSPTTCASLPANDYANKPPGKPARRKPEGRKKPPPEESRLKRRTSKQTAKQTGPATTRSGPPVRAPQ